jgi:hypothetical protein
VPREVIEGGRFLPTGLVRVVDYPDPYPMRSTKIVRVMNMQEAGPPAALRSDEAVGEMA